jgi:hypothetical protein
VKKKPGPAKVDNISVALIAAWDKASGKQRDEFVLARKAEIVRVLHQIGQLAFKAPGDGPRRTRSFLSDQRITCHERRS